MTALDEVLVDLWVAQQKQSAALVTSAGAARRGRSRNEVAASGEFHFRDCICRDGRTCTILQTAYSAAVISDFLQAQNLLDVAGRTNWRDTRQQSELLPPPPDTLQPSVNLPVDYDETFF